MSDTGQIPLYPPLSPAEQFIYDKVNSVGGQVQQGISATQAVGTQLNQAINNATNATANRINASQGLLSGQIAATGNALNNNVIAVGQSVIGSINSNSAALLINLQNTTNGINGNIAASTNSVKSTVTQTGDSVVSRIGGAIGNVQNAISMLISQSAGVIGERLSGISTQITNSLNAIPDAISTFLQQLLTTIQQLVFIAEHVVGVVGDSVGSWIKEKADFATHELDNRFKDLNGVIDKVKNNQYKTWDAFESDLKHLGVNTGLLQGVFNLVQFIPLIIQISQLTQKPFIDNLAHLADEKARSQLLNPSDLVELRRRKSISNNDFMAVLRKHGFTEQDIIALGSLTFRFLDENVIRALFLRGLISDSEHDYDLNQLGYDNHSIELIQQLYNFVPPVNDLVRFAVREVYTPATAQAYGLFEDFPADFEREAKKQGVVGEVARQYWAAHWELPSITMGYEMYHRGIITKAQLELLLKTLDVMPYWRDKLIQLSHSNLTRVDIRRLYKVGLIPANQVLQAYKDLGYDDQKAQWLADFAIKFEGSAETGDDQKIRELSQSVIIKGYIRNQITRTDALSRLVELNYDQNDAEILLAIADYEQYIRVHPDRTKEHNEKLVTYTLRAYIKRSLSESDAIENLLTAGFSEIEAQLELDFADLEYAIQFKQEMIGQIKALYLDGILDNNAVLARLTTMDFSQPEAQQIIDELQIAKSVNLKKPSFAQFTAFFKQGLITQDRYGSELFNMGYSNEDIDLFVLLYEPEPE